MTSPRSTRRRLPTPAGLSLHSPTAEKDLRHLGWYNEESVDLCWALSGTGDPDLALNTIIRLYGVLAAEEQETGGSAELDRALREDPELRVMLLSLVGGSSALGDHLCANPQLWRQLTHPIPDRDEMFTLLLDSIGARPAVFAGPAPHDTGDSAPGPDDSGAHGERTAVVAGDPTGGPAGRLPQGMALAARGDGRTIRAAGDHAGTYVATLTGKQAVTAMRQTYRSLLMRIAARDLAGSYLSSVRRPGMEELPFAEVTGHVSDLADAALTAALAVGYGEVYGDDPVDTRISVIAMGKCGARELNYISDVDVIFVAEPAHAKATRVAGEMIRQGSAAFFEIDAALRPEGKHGALVRTLDSHVAYYDKWADTWEFQAQLKARPATGDLVLGEAYIAALRPRVWEASKRESFVEDTQKMRARVVANVPGAKKERELKLGRGGLRDIEFAVQLLQMVHGRSDESLRVASTVDALAALIDGGYISRDDGHHLIQAYEFTRLLEHRLQLMRVKRTHLLPADNDDKQWRWLARSAGVASTGSETSDQTAKQLWGKIKRQVADLHGKLFFRPLLRSVVAIDTDTLKLTPESAKRQLKLLGYEFPDRAFEHLKYLAQGSRRAAKIQALLLPTLMEWLSDTADPDAGLLNYRKLCDAAQDHTWFLRMLRDEGIVGHRLMIILGNSPYVSDLFVNAPDMVKLLGDGAAGPKLLDADPDAVSSALVVTALRHSDPDRAIAAARSLRRRELARVAAADLLGMMDVREVCRSLSLVWDAVLEAALRAEVKAALDDDGRAKAVISVIGMGRLGGHELGYGSDADVMFVCEPTKGTNDNEAIKWSIGVVDRMRRRLSKPSGDPPLDVDLGLRPEGRSGAVVRTLDSYERYYRQWGETWEIQALLRATSIAGDKELGERFCLMVDQFRYPDTGVSKKTVRDVRRMKARVDNERLPKGADKTVHTKLGRGALTDIEWTVQLLQLEHAHDHVNLRNTSTLEVLGVLADDGILTTDQADKLRRAWLTATRARNALVLVKGKRTDQLPQPGPHLAPVAGAAGWDPDNYQEFYEHYLKTTRLCRHVVDEVFWGEETSFEP
ncbi:bifunctional [glutamine synthetase] adenylyltransferase/[glutamine synthetase]-adenylyl-L-tyrosine phosphorylase [Corynebacterium sp. CCM 8862]|uniref:Bifunctional [glutamine synthetase] adenylyltransferase/[glutamine synthetase]-adenylyl-L-tyrosine phosphorylase n=2 Tax=Corynebacterium mendelii TaxID=2765362 RepID=A0A939DY96_9CORY|nr:bifunctional [glutamine synthetase] adenylyltransferase/[glutamine synthetase]-adenylyl-L-tyrosine phosphorylase [Corynebacterium mendelii]MBN9643019.1 bifunctional [glutamine synthetase] adenylyltransferase/[glutamine synthetase]-adenylyl-L-tyrosine phosphorylase [Corynebacterium mendelii]